MVQQKRQHSRPYIFKTLNSNDNATPLQRLSFSQEAGATYDEDWIQNALFAHPELLPIEEIEPIFTPLIPVCRELLTPAGPLDVLYINDEGLLTIVECKLWRNPEARRHVVGQILDYAKDLSRWDYSELQAAIRRATDQSFDLYKLVQARNPELDEATFSDSVTRNLRRGRFLLLIAGDGIRESVEHITTFLQHHAGLHFTFSLVELATFALPDTFGGGYLVQPRVLTRTVEVERAVVRIEGSAIQITAPSTDAITSPLIKHRGQITEQVFYEELAKTNPTAVNALQTFLDKCVALGLTISSGTASMSIHWQHNERRKINFGSIHKAGELDTSYIVWQTDELGDYKIGEEYLDGLAALLEYGSVRKSGKYWTWRTDDKGRRPLIWNCLNKQDQWLALIEEAMSKIVQIN